MMYHRVIAGRYVQSFQLALGAGCDLNLVFGNVKKLLQVLTQCVGVHLLGAVLSLQHTVRRM